MSAVLDENTGEHIIKLVNMLPVGVTGNIDLTPLGIKAPSAKALQLAGMPDDKAAIPSEVTVTLPDVTLPPYSFTLFRVR